MFCLVGRTSSKVLTVENHKSSYMQIIGCPRTVNPVRGRSLLF